MDNVTQPHFLFLRNFLEKYPKSKPDLKSPSFSPPPLLSTFYIYYRNVEIEGNRTIKGRYPITEELARRADCYHFIYDNSGKLIEVAHLNDGRVEGRIDNLGISIAKIKIS